MKDKFTQYKSPLLSGFPPHIEEQTFKWTSIESGERPEELISVFVTNANEAMPPVLAFWNGSSFKELEHGYVLSVTHYMEWEWPYA